MATYVISDIHGHYDIFQKLLRKIKFSDSDTLYILGDNFDRGVQNLALYDFIVGAPNVTSLIGNHELMILDDIDALLESKPYSGSCTWLRNGGFSTFTELEQREKVSPGFIKKFLCELRKWKSHKILEFNGTTFILVHAGYMYPMGNAKDPEWILRHTPQDYKVWARDFACTVGIPDTVVIFGHTPTLLLPLGQNGGIWRLPASRHQIGIDCGSYHTNELGILRLDDMRAFYAGSNRQSTIIE